MHWNQFAFRRFVLIETNSSLKRHRKCNKFPSWSNLKTQVGSFRNRSWWIMNEGLVFYSNSSFPIERPRKIRLETVRQRASGELYPILIEFILLRDWTSKNVLHPFIWKKLPEFPLNNEYFRGCFSWWNVWFTISRVLPTMHKFPSSGSCSIFYRTAVIEGWRGLTNFCTWGLESKLRPY